MFSALLLLCLVVPLLAGIAPSSPDATRLNVTCPQNQAAFDNSEVTFTYTAVGNETVEASFVYSTNCTNSNFSVTSTGVSGRIGGSCFGGSVQQVRMVAIAMQYGGVFRSSDHLYWLVCQYTASQTVRSNATISNPQAWVPGQVDNSTTTIKSGAASNENITLEFVNAQGSTVTQVALGDAIALKIELFGSSVYSDFTVDSITAYSSTLDFTYNMTSSQCPAAQASNDNIDASLNSTSSITTRKLTNHFPAFRFQQDRVVTFIATVSFCVPGMTTCTSSPTCSGTGRRRRSVRVERQAQSASGGLQNQLFVLAQDEIGTRILIPINRNQDQTVQTEKESCLSSTTLYASIGAGGALLLLLLVLLVLLLVRRSAPKKAH